MSLCINRKSELNTKQLSLLPQQHRQALPRQLQLDGIKLVQQPTPASTNLVTNSSNSSRSPTVSCQRRQKPFISCSSGTRGCGCFITCAANVLYHTLPGSWSISACR